MFGDTFYRFPKLFIFFCAVKTLWLPYVLQGVIAAHRTVSAPDYPLVLISVVPCLTVILTVNNILVFNRMYDIACSDMQAGKTLEKYPLIDRNDYLLWSAMEAYKLYRNKHRDDKDSFDETCKQVCFIMIILQLIFMSVLV